MSHLARESGLYYDPNLMLKCREIGEVADKKLLVRMNKCQFLISVDSDSKIQFGTSIYLLSLFLNLYWNILSWTTNVLIHLNCPLFIYFSLTILTTFHYIQSVQ